MNRFKQTSMAGKLSWRLLILILLGVSGPMFAHHGVSAYDYTKTILAKNVTVTQWDWANPHCKIHFDVTDARHNVQHWVVEMHPPEALMEHGWTRQTLHTGDVISLSFRPGKDFSTSGLLIDMTLPNGIQLVQNLLQLPPGKTMSLQEWSNYITQKSPQPNVSSPQSTSR